MKVSERDPPLFKSDYASLNICWNGKLSLSLSLPHKDFKRYNSAKSSNEFKTAWQRTLFQCFNLFTFLCYDFSTSVLGDGLIPVSILAPDSQNPVSDQTLSSGLLSRQLTRKES